MSNREHWAQHGCCIPIHNGNYASDARGGVYSCKNEGKSAYVLLTVHEGPFSFDVKMNPAMAERIAALLTKAASSAREADAAALTEPA